MQTIPNVATSDNYSAGCTLEDIGAIAGSYIVANAAVIAKFRPKRADGTQAPYGPEQLLPPQSNNVVNCAGMAFRSAAAGVPAQVVAVLYDKDDALPGAPTPFSQTITAGGGIVPAVASVQVQKSGVLVGTEPTLDFEAADWAIVDDGPNTRIKLTPPAVGGIIVASGKRAAQITTSGTTYGTGIDLLASDLSFTADGVKNYVLFAYAAEWNSSNIGNNILRLKFDGADSGDMFQLTERTAGDNQGMIAAAYITAPAAGVHTCNARASVGSGTLTIFGGAGGAGTFLPIFLLLFSL